MRTNLLLVAICLTFVACETQVPLSDSSFSSSSMAAKKDDSSSSIKKIACFPGSCGLPPMTDEQLRKVLSPEQYEIMRQKGTEVPFTSPLNDEHRAGTFVAADTGEPLFRSEAKFDSGTGWPSFFQPIDEEAVVEHTDTAFGMARTEVLTRNGSHLGHVFPDGPNPTGLRYCINGAALKFVPDEPTAK